MTMRIVPAVLLFLAAVWPSPSAGYGEKLGAFFDSSAYINWRCGPHPPLVPFDLYFALVEVEGPVLGFEFSYKLSPSTTLVRVAADIPGVGPIDVGDSHDPFDGFYMCGLAEPHPPFGRAIILVHWQMIEMGDPGVTVSVNLGPIRFASLPGGLPVVEGGEGFGLRRVGVNSAYNPPLGPVALINGCFGTPVEASSFGSVKSLFR